MSHQRISRDGARGSSLGAGLAAVGAGAALLFSWGMVESLTYFLQPYVFPAYVTPTKALLLGFYVSLGVAALYASVGAGSDR